MAHGVRVERIHIMTDLGPIGRVQTIVCIEYGDIVAGTERGQIAFVTM